MKIVGSVAAVLLLLGIGAAVGGGIVYAMRQARRSDGLTIYSEEVEAEPGVVVASVIPDGPAAGAGVRRGDILLELDGESVDSVVQLARALDGYQPGDKVELTVLHGDDERTLTVTLQERDGAPYLGIVPCVGVPAEVGAVRVGAPGPGALIVEVEPDSPADKAGLEEGDVIVGVDDQVLDSEASLADVIAEYEPGDKVTLEIESPGEEPREVAIELGEHPEEEGVAYLGVRYRSVLHRRLTIEGLPFQWHHFEGPFPDLPEGDFLQGTVVQRVKADSPADEAGLREGDLISAIDGEPVRGSQDLADAISEREPGEEVMLTVHRSGDDEEQEIEVTLGEHPDEEGKAYLGVSAGGHVILRRFGGEWPEEMESFEPFLDEWKPPFDRREAPGRFQFRFYPKHLESDLECCGSDV